MNRAFAKAPRHQRGFTLLELLVVLIVFAVMSAMAYGGLSAVLKTRSKVQSALKRSEAFEKTYLRMRQDFQNASQRTARDNDGVLQPALKFDRYNHRLEFTHGGWNNPLHLPRTGYERVAYTLDDQHRLIRSSFRVLDRAPRSEPVDLEMLDGVEEVQWHFLDASLQWAESWPESGPEIPNPLTPDNAPKPPAAVELKMRTTDWGELRFLFQLGFDSATLTPTSSSPPPGL